MGFLWKHTCAYKSREFYAIWNVFVESLFFCTLLSFNIIQKHLFSLGYCNLADTRSRLGCIINENKTDSVIFHIYLDWTNLRNSFHCDRKLQTWELNDTALYFILFFAIVSQRDSLQLSLELFLPISSLVNVCVDKCPLRQITIKYPFSFH